MITPEKTRKGGTYTSEGFIPHYRFGILNLPVKLNIPCNEYSLDRLFPPAKRSNQNLYVLPSGVSKTVEELKFEKNKGYGMMGMRLCST